MQELSVLFLTIGTLLVLSLLANAVGRRIFVPRVTLLMLFGIVIGPMFLDVLPDNAENWFPAIADVALAMIAFLLGQQLSLASLRESGREVMVISLVSVSITAALVFAGLRLVGVPVEVALLLAGIAPATAPAATLDVIREYQAKGPFARVLKGIVALDDLWGLILFSVLLAMVHFYLGVGGVNGTLLHAARDLGGAVMVGLVVGAPAAYLSGRIQPGEPMMIEALGMVLICLGLSLWFDVSFLIAAMVMGAVVINLARHHEYSFNAIEGIEQPFLILFFVLAGASIRIDSLSSLGLIGGGYIVLRVLGRLLGGWLGSVACRADESVRRWIGLAMMPQAGVAVGMALLAAQRLPETGETVLAVVIATTVIFEISGPLFTRLALMRTAGSGSRQE